MKTDDEDLGDVTVRDLVGMLRYAADNRQFAQYGAHIEMLTYAAKQPKDLNEGANLLVLVRRYATTYEFEITIRRKR